MVRLRFYVLVTACSVEVQLLGGTLPWLTIHDALTLRAEQLLLCLLP